MKYLFMRNSGTIMSLNRSMLPFVCGLVVGCSPQENKPTDVAAPIVQATSIQVHGPMPVVLAENMVNEALPALLACWTGGQSPCGTITVSHQGTRHGQ